VRSEVADVTGIVKYIRKSVFGSKTWGALRIPLPPTPLSMPESNSSKIYEPFSRDNESEI